MVGEEKRQRGRSTVEMELERRKRVELGHKELHERKRCTKNRGQGSKDEKKKRIK